MPPKLHNTKETDINATLESLDIDKKGPEEESEEQTEEETTSELRKSKKRKLSSSSEDSCIFSLKIKTVQVFFRL